MSSNPQSQAEYTNQMTTEIPAAIPLSRGIWASPSPVRSPFASEASLAYPATYDSVASSAADYEAYRSGGIAWGSATSASGRRSSHALTEPEGSHRSLSRGDTDFPRRSSLNGRVGTKQSSAPFLSSLSFHPQPKNNFLGPSISLLDQFSNLADATRQTELAHRLENVHVSDVPSKYQTTTSSSSSKSTSPVSSESRLWNGAWKPQDLAPAPVAPAQMASPAPVAPPSVVSPAPHPVAASVVPPLAGAPKSKAPPPRKKDWKRGRRSENPLLEELRSRNHPLRIEDMLGQVLEVSTDQHGSRFIQEQLSQATPEVRQRFFEETEPHRLQLMTDVFGNYVIQQLFELGTPAQRSTMVKQMSTRVLSLSLQMYGCRVVQMAIRHSSEAEQVSLVDELRTHVVRCIKDHNGNHVIQKAIECVAPKHVQFIYKDLMNHTLELSRHTYGCRVVQRILEFGDAETRHKLVIELKALIDRLVEDQYGNYVVQHIVDHGPAEDRDWVLERLVPRLVVLSTHKYASNVIEKCFLRGTPRQRSAMITAILENDIYGVPSVVTMIRDQYANYVVQKMLDNATADDRRRLVAAIKPHIATIKRNFYGKHLAAIEKLLHE
ncbi:Pumilio 2 [Wickerhamiella sorbophila]|uniref:Pumilio homology domain family member 3 n=1 Tax=Wickerhamiella sorbophila TaxID=45607 RepID=A0A2T0FDJ5_9ASCO|nr:Pumilio 2 [Wickerhamiella sorbophila]PRT53040.1 Pumilio 2 [Wickerhamiella sorbophila]